MLLEAAVAAQVNLHEAAVFESIEHLFAEGLDRFEHLPADFSRISPEATLRTDYLQLLSRQPFGMLSGEEVSLVAFGHDRWPFTSMEVGLKPWQ